MKYIRYSILVISFVLAACTGTPKTSDSDFKISSEQDTRRATTSLLAKVDVQEQARHWERAAALLERALRIEPRNAYLWHRLAKVRLQQGQFTVAENLVKKSNSLARGDKEIIMKNNRLLERVKIYTRDAPF